MNNLFKYFYHKCLDRSNRWYPFLSVYYLTYRCNFRCPYCSNGFNKPYYELSPEIVSGEKVLDILKRIRRHCDYLVITGGEPLLHPDFSYVMEHLPKLKFKHVALNTNGFELERFLPQIAGAVHTLIISLDTLNETKADTWHGRSNIVVGATGSGEPNNFTALPRSPLQKILANIDLAAKTIPRKSRILISSVATPKNIGDLYEVYDYCRRRSFTFAACPVLMGVKPPAELKTSSAYRAFFDFLIREKRKGADIFGTPLYLAYMRDFIKFRCHPFTMLVVDPRGNIFYPCLELGRICANILESDDLHTQRREAHTEFGPQPDCDARCHSACALGFSLILEQPWSLFQEVLYRTKNHLFQQSNKDNVPLY
jgi:MoaA/NifB/PqqE/SkfB family radical SAM enzyme